MELRLSSEDSKWSVSRLSSAEKSDIKLVGSFYHPENGLTDRSLYEVKIRVASLTSKNRQKLPKPNP